MNRHCCSVGGWKWKREAQVKHLTWKPEWDHFLPPLRSSCSCAGFKEGSSDSPKRLFKLPGSEWEIKALTGFDQSDARNLRDAAAAVSLGIIVFYRLLEPQQGRVSAGRREVDRAAVGRDERHARIFGTGFGGAVSQVAVEDGLGEEFGGGALLLEFGQRLWPIFGLGLLDGGWGVRVTVVRGHRVTVRSGRCWSAGDGAVLSPAVLQDPGWSRSIVRLRLQTGSQNINTKHNWSSCLTFKSTVNLCTASSDRVISAPHWLGLNCLIHSDTFKRQLWTFWIFYVVITWTFSNRRETSQITLKLLHLCLEDKTKSFVFEMTQGGVSDDSMIIFGWTNPLIKYVLCAPEHMDYDMYLRIGMKSMLKTTVNYIAVCCVIKCNFKKSKGNFTLWKYE